MATPENTALSKKKDDGIYNNQVSTENFTP
jgi:hypothetical protein